MYKMRHASISGRSTLFVIFFCKLFGLWHLERVNLFFFLDSLKYVRHSAPSVTLLYRRRILLIIHENSAIYHTVFSLSTTNWIVALYAHSLQKNCHLVTYLKQPQCPFHENIPPSKTRCQHAAIFAMSFDIPAPYKFAYFVSCRPDDTVDDAFFSHITSKCFHALHSLLPNCFNYHYDVRNGRHQL